MFIVSTRLALIAYLSLAALACGGRQAAVPDASANIEEVTPTEEEPRAHRSAMSRGIEAAAAGRFRAAAGWFDEAIARGEDAAEAFTNRAVAYAAQGRWGLAISDAEVAIEEGGGEHARTVLLGIQVRAGLVDAAVSVPISEPTATDLLVLRAIALSAQGEQSAAQEVLHTVPNAQLDAAALNTLGIVSERLGDFDAATDFYNRAIGADTEAYEPWRNLGMLLTRQGEDDAAAARALERYLVLAPREAMDRGVIEGRVATLRE